MMEIRVTETGEKLQSIKAIHEGICQGEVVVGNTIHIPTSIIRKKTDCGICVVTCKKCGLQAMVSDQDFIPLARSAERKDIKGTFINDGALGVRGISWGKSFK